METNNMVSIISVNYNGFEVTCEMIESIYQHVTSPFEIIVVDNGSFENEAALLSNKYPQIRAIRSEKNLGFAGGNNIGIKEAKGDYILLLNNDTTVDSDFLKPLLSGFGLKPEIGVICPKIKFEFEPETIQFAGYAPLTKITLRNFLIGFNQKDNGQFEDPQKTPYAHGAAMMLKKDVIQKAGLMPELYFLYYEELDWSELIKRAGYEIWYEPKSVVYHKESASTGQNSPLRNYYLSRNRIYFARRNRKGLSRILSLLYQSCIVMPKDSLKSLLQKRPDLAKAVYKGTISGITNKI